MRELVLEIPGEPQSWDRAGINARGKIKFFDRKAKEKGFIRNCFSRFIQALPLNSPEAALQQEIFDSAIKIDVSCFFLPPASLSKRDKILLSWGLLYKKTRGDIDNLCKLLMDAGNGILYKDDAQIVSLSSKKKFSHNPRTVVKIGIMDIDKTVLEIVQGVPFDQVNTICTRSISLKKLIDTYNHRSLSEAKEDLELIHNIVYTLSRIAYECEDALLMMLKHKSAWRFIPEPFNNEFKK
jgi:Holliday junction resolvase RusA-like endonuclease